MFVLILLIRSIVLVVLFKPNFEISCDRFDGGGAGSFLGSGDDTTNQRTDC
jgi:hypothetical protein